MTDHPAAGDVAAFKAALGRLFEEYRPVSDGFGVIDRTRLDRLTGRTGGERIRLGRGEGGIFSASITESLPPGTDIDDCFSLIPTYPEGVLTWECYVYEGPEGSGSPDF